MGDVPDDAVVAREKGFEVDDKEKKEWKVLITGYGVR